MQQTSLVPPGRYCGTHRRECDIGVIDMARFMAGTAWSDAAKGEARGRRGAPTVRAAGGNAAERPVEMLPDGTIRRANQRAVNTLLLRLLRPVWRVSSGGRQQALSAADRAGLH